MGRKRLGLAAAVGAIALVVLPAAPASAHADYRSSNPGDGATVSSPPSSVRAEFTEPPSEGSTLQITDPCGQRVDSADYRYEGFPINSITVSMSGDKAGQYRVVWTVISEADGHTTRGTFDFTSSGGSACPGGGGGNNNNSGGSGGNNNGGTGSQEPAGGSGGGAPGSGDGGNNNNGGSQKGNGGNKNKSSKSNSKTTSGPGSEEPNRDITLTQSPQQPASTTEEELPLDWLVVGLSVAAIIGAIGGRVYAGIVGPR